MGVLYLSHWNDPTKVFVPEEIHLKFKAYHFSIVRSLYRCIQKKYSGAILNYDDGINVALAFQALWQALITAQQVKLPILVISSDKNVVEWHYHLSKLGEIIILSNQNHERVLEDNHFSVILVPECNLKLLQSYREKEFSFVVVEDFDLVATKVLFKRLSGQFNVALTRRDFMIDRDYKILWHTLNWISPRDFGKLNDFADFDCDHLENLRNPYDEIWYSYNHNRGDYNFDDKAEDEKKEYQETLKKWAKQNALAFNNTSKQNTRKRKRNVCNDNNIKVKKCSEKTDNERYDVNYHENETQLAGEVIVKNNEENLEDCVEARGIRDVTDLNYSELIREDVKVVPQKQNVEKSPVKFPFLRSENVNTKKKIFKFLDENERPVGKQSQPRENNIIVEADASSVNETSIHVSKKASEDPVSRNSKEIDVCGKSIESRATNSTKLDMSSCTSVGPKILSKEISKRAKVSIDVQKQVFPSLEDILTFKKKDLADLLLIRRHKRQLREATISRCASRSFSEEKLFRNNSEKESIASLEEVFGCKRKYDNIPHIVKKLHAGVCNYDNVSMKFTFEGDLNRIKLCEPRRIFYTDIKMPNNYHESVEFVSKATQTNNQMTVHFADKPLNACLKTINIGNRNLEEETEGHNEVRNTRINRGNTIEKNVGKPLKCDPANSSGNIEKNEEINSASVSQENSLKNSINMRNIEDEEEEGQELLLSIVEGRFVSHSMFKKDDNHYQKELTGRENIAATERRPNTIRRYNSKTLLGSLFGDGAECLQGGLDESSKSKNISDKWMSSNSQQHQHLKVRTIDQINGEDSSRNSSDIYDSTRFFFSTNNNIDKEKKLNEITKSKNFGTNKFDGNRNNLSSLFG